MHGDDVKLIGKHKTIWTQIKNLKNIELDAFPVYNGSYIITKIKTCGGKIYSNFLV